MNTPLTYYADQIPDLPEPILAYRAWGISWPKDWQPLLHGFANTVWPTNKPLTAECMLAKESTGWGRPTATRTVVNGVVHIHESHHTPCEDVPASPGSSIFGGSPSGHVGYGCGIYAYKNPLQMIRHCSRSNKHVWGRVLLWGKVFDHKGGYRAEHAQIHSFIPMFEDTWNHFSDPNFRRNMPFAHVDAMGIPHDMINKSPLRLRMLAAITGIPLIDLEEDPEDLLAEVLTAREEEEKLRQRQMARLRLIALQEARRTIDADSDHYQGEKGLRDLVNKLRHLSTTPTDGDKKDEGEDDGTDRKPSS